MKRPPIPIRIKQMFKEHTSNCKCPICNKTFFVLDLHHKDGNPFNNKSNNFFPVCRKCHSGLHSISYNGSLKKDLKGILNPKKNRYNCSKKLCK